MGDREIVKCSRHPDRPAVATCPVCGEPVCAACAHTAQGKYYCPRDIPSGEAAAKAPPRGGRWRPAYLVALGAVVALAGGGLYALRPVSEKAAALYRGEMTKMRLAEVAAGADDFKADLGQYPTAEEGLRALTAEPEGTPRWLGPYVPEAYVVEEAVVDADGRPLGYRASAEEHVVFSVGEDGEPGTADDVELCLERRLREPPPAAFPGLFGFLERGGRARKI